MVFFFRDRAIHPYFIKRENVYRDGLMYHLKLIYLTLKIIS